MRKFVTPPRTAPIPWLVVALFGPTLLLLAACGGDRTTSSAPDRRRLATEPAVRIGSLDDTAQALVNVNTLAVGPGGRVWVAQPPDGQVRVFDARGQLVRRVGRRGDGPGEFAGVSAMGFLGDTLWVADNRARRFSLFDTAGTFLNDFPMEQAQGLAEGVQGPSGVLAPGHAVVIATSAAFGSDLEGSDYPFPLLLQSPSQNRTTPIATRYAAHDRAVFTQLSGGEIQGVSVFPQLWSDVTLWQLAPDGRSVVLVDRRVVPDDPRPTYGVTRVALSGDTTFSVRVPYDPRPVDRAFQDTVIQAWANPTVSESELRRTIFLPATYPPASDLTVGRDGTVWVAREKVSGDPVRDWDVFDTAGRLGARVQAPADFRILDATRDAVWGVTTDELGVPYVLRYAVEDAGPEEPSSGAAPVITYLKGLRAPTGCLGETPLRSKQKCRVRRRVLDVDSIFRGGEWNARAARQLAGGRVRLPGPWASTREPGSA